MVSFGTRRGQTPTLFSLHTLLTLSLTACSPSSPPPHPPPPGPDPLLDGIAFLKEGDARSAIEQLLPVLETSRHFEAGQLETAALCSLGRARFQVGDLVGAVRALELSVKLCETTLEHHAAICGRAWLAEALWVQEPARARVLLETALRTGRDRGMVVELAGAKETARRLGVDEGR